MPIHKSPPPLEPYIYRDAKDRNSTKKMIKEEEEKEREVNKTEGIDLKKEGSAARITRRSLRNRKNHDSIVMR